MIRAFQKKMNPACYQGPRRDGPHFEGWYFKLIAPAGKHALAIIPGVFHDDAGDGSHAFIQVFDGRTNATHYLTFSRTSFSAADRVFDVRVDASRFTGEAIDIDAAGESCSLTGRLTFAGCTPWPRTLLSPGIMGWYAWVPFMECYHGVVSLDHTIEGTLILNGESMNFSGGRGYSEKDWGRSFPEAWIWCQCNHFPSTGSSLTGSVAIIPWIRRPFPGYIFGLLHRGSLYRFTTYTGAVLEEFEVDDQGAHCVLRQKNRTLEVRAARAPGGILRAPTLNGMTHAISESMASTVEVTLSEGHASHRSILMRETGRHAGFEAAGDMQRLLTMHRHENHHIGKE